MAASWISVGIGAASTVSGVIAAALWYRASEVAIPGDFSKLPTALAEVSRLNKLAARWTAITAMLAGIAALLGAMHPPAWSLIP